MEYDAIVIGGSYAGLSAATQLARARRRVLVVDAGQRRNRFAQHAHGFLTQDGKPPDDIAALGRQQLQHYPTVTWLDGTAVDAMRLGDGFAVQIEGHGTSRARRLVIASGVVDQLPEVPGLAERWGRHVFHCPYCHGYELDQGRIGVLATTPLSIHLAMMLPDWGPTQLFLNECFEPDENQQAQLAQRGVQIERTRVARIEGMLDMVLADGRTVALDGLFVPTRTQSASPIPSRLGCEMEAGPMGHTLKTDAMKATSVAGVFACGDLLRQGGSVALAVADGAVAGVAAHQSLIFQNH